MDEYDLSHSPRAFIALYRNGKVGLDRLAFNINESPVRQLLREGAEQQISLFHRAEVRAIDPDHINRAVVIFACVFFSDHTGHRI